jgi:CRP/FNR family transcriptional regulator, cyclic AMP receptor protein
MIEQREPPTPGLRHSQVRKDDLDAAVALYPPLQAARRQPLCNRQYTNEPPGACDASHNENATVHDKEGRATMKATRDQIEAALGASFLFPLLGPQEKSRFVAAARQQSWRAGASIFAMGDPGSSMMLIQTGQVKISYPSSDGRVILLGEFSPPAVFGEIALLDGGNRSADATATTNCTLLVFERSTFTELLENNWPLADAVLKLVCARLRRSDERMADLAFFDLPTRLAKALLERAQPALHGSPSYVDDNQGAIAAMVGGSRESVNRCLGKWSKAGIVSTSDGRIYLRDIKRLMQTIDNNASDLAANADAPGRVARFHQRE